MEKKLVEPAFDFPPEVILQDKKIILGVTGGIAAYKAASLVRALRKCGCEVRVIMTEAATKMITPLTMSTLSANKVYLDEFTDSERGEVVHIELARWADAIVIAPATANTIAKVANGIADNLLTSVLLATAVPVVLAPAMNCQMWANAMTQENLKKLEKYWYTVVQPVTGDLACGDGGMGALAPTKDILKGLKEVFE